MLRHDRNSGRVHLLRLLLPVLRLLLVLLLLRLVLLLLLLLLLLVLRLPTESPVRSLALCLSRLGRASALARELRERARESVAKMKDKNPLKDTHPRGRYVPVVHGGFRLGRGRVSGRAAAAAAAAERAGLFAFDQFVVHLRIHA